MILNDPFLAKVSLYIRFVSKFALDIAVGGPRHGSFGKVNNFVIC